MRALPTRIFLWNNFPDSRIVWVKNIKVSSNCWWRFLTTTSAIDSVVFNPTTDHHRTIVHIDLDCFYAQVEMIRNPSLRDKPLGRYRPNWIKSVAISKQVYIVLTMWCTRPPAVHSSFLNKYTCRQQKCEKQVVFVWMNRLKSTCFKKNGHFPLFTSNNLSYGYVYRKSCLGDDTWLHNC